MGRRFAECQLPMQGSQSQGQQAIVQQVARYLLVASMFTCTACGLVCIVFLRYRIFVLMYEQRADGVYDALPRPSSPNNMSGSGGGFFCVYIHCTCEVVVCKSSRQYLHTSLIHILFVVQAAPQVLRIRAPARQPQTALCCLSARWIG